MWKDIFRKSLQRGPDSTFLYRTGNNNDLAAEYRRTTPYLIWTFRDRNDFYFDPEKWEEDWKKRNKK
jgi:hypothetical protein